MIVEPYATIVLGSDTGLVPIPEFVKKDFGIGLLRYIEAVGRVSHRSEDKQGPDTWEPFIKAVVLQHGDWSIVEHCTVTVEALVDRGITHEWVRHRIGAYTQESTRFVNYVKKLGLNFILPLFTGPDPITMESAWEIAIRECETQYNLLISEGATPQLARSVLPNALASKLIVTYNLRNWRHFFLMRTSKETHPQMKQVTIPLLQQFKETIPLLYDDIEPDRRQVDNLKMVR